MKTVIIIVSMSILQGLTIIFIYDSIMKIIFITSYSTFMKNQTNHDRGSLSVISDALPQLKGSAQKTAQFILDSPRETINLTITELGSRVGVSEASIVRFAQSLGYSGFHALKIRLAEDIVSPMLIVHEDLMPDDGPAIAVQKAMTVGPPNCAVCLR